MDVENQVDVSSGQVSVSEEESKNVISKSVREEESLLEKFTRGMSFIP